jgi:hypothetical protein
VQLLNSIFNPLSARCPPPHKTQVVDEMSIPLLDKAFNAGDRHQERARHAAAGVGDVMAAWAKEEEVEDEEEAQLKALVGFYGLPVESWGGDDGIVTAYSLFCTMHIGVWTLDES